LIERIIALSKSGTEENSN